MKQLYIDNRIRLVIVEGKVMPRLLLGILRGTIGKCFVVKHYKGNKKKKWKKRIVITKYPDMSGVVASEKQRERRDLFKEAVVYARWILSDPEQKKAFRKTLPRKKRKHVYQAAIRLYMRMQGDKQWLRKQLAVRGMMSTGRREMAEFMNGQWSMGNKRGRNAGRVHGAMTGVHAGGLNGCEQVGAWKVVWQKEEAVGLEVVGDFGKELGGLEVLRI
ncbi:hypothetical protein OCK74_26280 [Chitinophagaceae bacterium LB-8]|uniref:Uncharacterized protein n=1 Tax=Paraflavisolibacter caeni TaxID=2982496 RepID=A0A9X2Y0Y4_9BACT|nr:hypothetical protein [Paraflavisolibacter caeni]MCU7552655.1 hypothetical protein [Paraflavisolibacter caeni]